MPAVSFGENMETESQDSDTETGYNWEGVMQAIVSVESKGNTKVVNGQCVGPMQISPALLMECNRILKKRKSKKRFKLSDRFSLAKSKEMFVIFQSFYNPLNSIERAIRSWNGGINYTIKGTQRYLSKVLSAMK